jgi:thiamine pyrophosphate-dependent acetolactate synthase large subunit-like protein
MAPKVRQARELLFQVLEDIGIPFLFGLEGTTEIPLNRRLRRTSAN